MSKYLVVEFDRYDTHLSKHYEVEADTPFHAVVKAMNITNEFELSYLNELYEEVDGVFSCIPFEESDILIYKLN